jgi:secreted PhoX family phosphatase
MNARTTLAAALTASALAATAALAVVPAAATTNTTVHTLKFRSVGIREHNFGHTGGVSVDVDSVAGKTLAYDMVDFTSDTTGDVVLALNHGFIYAKLVFSSDGKLTGKVTGGSTRYAGVTGTVSGHPATNQTDTIVTVKYHH